MSNDALALLDLDPKVVEDPLFVKVFSGCEKLPGSETAAHNYCGMLCCGLLERCILQHHTQSCLFMEATLCTKICFFFFTASFLFMH